MRRLGWLVVLLCAAWDPVTRPQGDVAVGNKRLADGKLTEAEAHYRKALEALPGQPGVLFDLGAAHYAEAGALPKGGDRAKLLESAEKEFRLAGDAADTKLRASAHYNLGNALFQQDKFKDAIEEYKKSLKLDPLREDARRNLELALGRIAPPPPPPPKQQPRQGQDQKQDQQPQQQQQQQQQGSQGQKQQEAQQDPQQQQPQPQGQEQPQPQPGQEQPKPQPQGQEPKPAADEDAERKLDALERRSSDLQIAKARERARQRQRGKVVKDW